VSGGILNTSGAFKVGKKGTHMKRGESIRMTANLKGLYLALDRAYTGVPGGIILHAADAKHCWAFFVTST
jgi:hypothetical protein